MKLPLSLIKSYLPLELPPAQIGETLTLLGIEVDRIEHELPSFAKVVAAEVLSTQKHPDAKHLQMAQVSDGKKTWQIVCGASNCRAGLKTALAQIGAVLTDRDGVQRRIEKTVIRGVESWGMLCSASELGLPEEGEGILELPDGAELGADLTASLWDPIFELSLTPNLGHCMSALGIARELSAALQIPLSPPSRKLEKSSLSFSVQVKDPSLCRRYLCALVEGVQVQPSPFWLRQQLAACGQKSINQVVDAANYIMMKTGQPFHTFDADLLEGNRLEIGRAGKAQTFLGLDGIEREIPADALVIRDGKKIVAIAGVMGSAHSAISEKTTRVLIEAADFDPIAVRNTAKKLSLRTESSQRFEKGIDPVAIPEALGELIPLLGGICRGVIDLQQGSLSPKKISYRPDRVNQILGTKLSASEMEEIFRRLGFQVKHPLVEVPLYRADLHEEIDLIEEIARIYGYQHIEKKRAKCTLSQVANDPLFSFENELRIHLSGLGLFEFLSCDLISPKWADLCREITPSSMEFLKAAHSKSEEYSILRTSLLPPLLQSVSRNLAQKNRTFGAFEIGRIHFSQNGKLVEIPMLAILLTGQRFTPHWSEKSPPFDFFDLKGMVETIAPATCLPSQHLSFHPSRQADLSQGHLQIGSLGQIHPTLLEKFGIDQPVYYAELHLTHLLQAKKGEVRVTPLAQFPSSERDLTLSLPLKMRIDSLLTSVQSPLLEKVELIDIYHPEAASQKNITFRFTYRDRLKTVSFEEVESEHAKIIEQISKLLAK